METRRTIETEIENLMFGYWDDGEEKIIDLESKEDFLKFLEREDWQQELIGAIAMFKDNLVDKLTEDLADIWRRLDRLEE